MPKFTIDGSCPYCFATNWDSTTTEKRPDQVAYKCLDCTQYSIRHLGNGKQYPIDNPMDLNSDAYIARND